MFQESTFEGLKSFRESFVNTYKWKFYFTSTLLRSLHASWFEKRNNISASKNGRRNRQNRVLFKLVSFLFYYLSLITILADLTKGKTENQVVPALLCWKYAKRNCIVIFFWNYAYVILFVKLKLCFANSGLFNDL